MIDIGGGSTELVVGEHTDVLLARSLKLGAIRLTDRFFPGGEIHAKAVGECRTYVRSFLAPAVADVRGSGTVHRRRQLGDDPQPGADRRRPRLRRRARSAAATRSRPTGCGRRWRRFSSASMPPIVLASPDSTTIAATSSSAARSSWPRSSTCCRSNGSSCPRLRCARASWSTGSQPATARKSLHRLSDIRRRSVMRMAETFHENLDHIGRATDLSLQLFDGLRVRASVDRGRPRPARSCRPAAQRGALRLARRPPPPLVLRDPQHRSAGGLHRPRGGADRPDRTLPPQERAEVQASGVRGAVAGRSAAGAAARRDVAVGDRARPHPAGRGRHADRPAAVGPATGDRHRRARCARTPTSRSSGTPRSSASRCSRRHSTCPCRCTSQAAPSLPAETADSLP